MLDEALAAIHTVKVAGGYAHLFMPESTRITLPQLRETLVAAEQAGADAFTVVDSLAICRPAALAYLVRQAVALTDRPIEVHCHSDYGLATACMLAAYEAGVSALNCSINAEASQCRRLPHHHRAGRAGGLARRRCRPHPARAGGS